jgi:hypothetical protein
MGARLSAGITRADDVYVAAGQKGFRPEKPMSDVAWWLAVIGEFLLAHRPAITVCGLLNPSTACKIAPPPRMCRYDTWCADLDKILAPAHRQLPSDGDRGVLMSIRLPCRPSMRQPPAQAWTPVEQARPLGLRETGGCSSLCPLRQQNLGKAGALAPALVCSGLTVVSRIRGYAAWACQLFGSRTLSARRQGTT